jgi:hypothetical protein
MHPALLIQLAKLRAGELERQAAHRRTYPRETGATRARYVAALRMGLVSMAPDDPIGRREGMATDRRR